MNIINYDINTSTISVSSTGDLSALTIPQYQLILIDQLDNQTTAYIFNNYPQSKQLSDHVDLQFWGGWLQNYNTAYTTQYVYTTVYSNAYKVATSQTSFQTVISSFPTVEQAAWAHMISAAIRIGWVQTVKEVYTNEYNNIINQTTISDLENIDVSSVTYPLFINISTLTTSVSATG